MVQLSVQHGPSSTAGRIEGGVTVGEALGEVSSTLWRERELLELLQFKLEEEQLVLAAQRSRWLPHATREVEMVLEEIKRAELARAVEVERVAELLGLAAAPSLHELIETAPAPWGDILAEHRKALMAATEEIQSLADANRDLLQSAHRAAREALAALSEPETNRTYTASGRASRPSGPRLVDGAM